MKSNTDLLLERPGAYGSVGPSTSAVTKKAAAVSAASRQFDLECIFSSQREGTQSQRARRIMGDEVGELSDAELESHLSQFQSLIDFWLDEFERQNFEGHTLREVFNGE